MASPVSSMASSINSRLRMNGLATGIDTDAIVKSLMANRQNKVTKMSQQMTLSEWKKDAYTDVNNQLRVFREKYLSALSTDSMLSKNAYSSYKIENNSTKYVGISTNGVAKDGNHTLAIKQLATASTATSSGMTTVDVDENGNPLANAKPLTEAQLSKAITDLPPKTLDVSFDEKLGASYVSFKINDVRFDFKSDQSINDIMNKVNGSAAGVNMKYDSNTGKFSIESKTQGNNLELDPESKIKDYVKIENINGTMFGTDGGFSKIKDDTYRNGLNAQITLDGVDIVKSSNSFNVDNVVYNLKMVTEAAKPIDFSLERDVQPTIDKIKGFVDAYNDLMKSLNTSVTEKKNKDYYPLTSEMKAEMSEKEIEQWEKQAKAGLLRNDPTITKLRDDMRSLFSDKVSGIASMASIGLHTGDYYASSLDGFAGKIEIDTEKLRDALTNNPTRVADMFTHAVQLTSANDFISYDDAKRYNHNETILRGGFMQRVTQLFDEFSNSMRDNTLKNLTDGITLSTQRIADETKRLNSYEDSLYARFTAMEKAIQSMNAQSSWFAAQTGQSG